MRNHSFGDPYVYVVFWALEKGWHSLRVRSAGLSKETRHQLRVPRNQKESIYVDPNGMQNNGPVGCFGPLSYMRLWSRHGICARTPSCALGYRGPGCHLRRDAPCLVCPGAIWPGKYLDTRGTYSVANICGAPKAF